MKVKVLGYRYAEGTSKKNGRPFKGFFTSIGYEQNGYTGLKVEERFFSTEALQGLVPEVGEELEVSVDFGGFVTSVKRLSNPHNNYNAPMNQ